MKTTLLFFALTFAASAQVSAPRLVATDIGCCDMEITVTGTKTTVSVCPCPRAQLVAQSGASPETTQRPVCKDDEVAIWIWDNADGLTRIGHWACIKKSPKKFAGIPCCPPGEPNCHKGNCPPALV